MSTHTQEVCNGLYELTDAAKAELSSSKYYNEDLAPTSVSQRTWTTYNISMLWVGMSICIPSLSLASGLITVGVSPWLSIINVALGNIIVLIPIQLNSQIGTKYGVPFPLFARLTFGGRGAQIPAILRAITACGWTSVQAWVGEMCIRDSSCTVIHQISNCGKRRCDPNIIGYFSVLHRHIKITSHQHFLIFDIYISYRFFHSFPPSLMKNIIDSRYSADCLCCMGKLPCLFSIHTVHVFYE